LGRFRDSKNHKTKRLLIASKTRLEMLQNSQSHLLYGSGISAAKKQDVEADRKGQRGQYAKQHAFMVETEFLELLKEVG